MSVRIQATSKAVKEIEGCSVNI